MKKFLNNSLVAFLIAAVVIIGSTLISTKVRFGPICTSVNDGFSFGIGSESAIATELKNLCNASDKLMILADQNGLDYSEEIAGRVASMRMLLNEENKDLHSIYALYENILRDSFSLESSLARMSLSDADSESYTEAQHEAASAKASVDSSSYNEIVRRFQNRYRHFPTVQLADLAGISMPELFA